LAQSADPMGIDDAFVNPAANPVQSLTNDELLTGDWTKGPIGTREASWTIPGIFILQLSTGSIAESWEIPDEQTIVYHIRKGIRFHDKPPVNGRELTADDVVYSFKRAMETKAGYWYASYREPVLSVTARDKWTVVVKSPPGEVDSVILSTADFQSIVPREMVEKYGDLRKWEASCGTGPFMLVDSVPASSWAYKKNPNYWRKDPFNPENTLPYLDGVKFLIIPDLSTRVAALRTGKVDWLGSLTWEEKQNLTKTNPELKFDERAFIRSFNIHMRLDKPEFPWRDIRVRRALAMAIDKQAIKDKFYGGYAELLTHPINPSEQYAEYKGAYIPLKDLPQSVQELFEYHPDRAKQLLTEAGYPKGFKAKVICLKEHVDLLSLAKDYWAKIGVDLELQVKEVGVYRSIMVGRTHEQMIMAEAPNGANFKLLSFRPESYFNWSMVDDSRCNEAWRKIAPQVVRNWPEVMRILRELIPYALEQAWSIQTPTPYFYTMWQPWVKGYHGESDVGFGNYPSFLMFVWYDQELKSKMTGRK